MSIDDAEAKQEEFNAVIGVLNKYILIKPKYDEAKNKFLNHVENFYKEREKIIEGFKSEIFLFNYDKVVEEQARYEEEEKNIKNGNGLIDYRRLQRLLDLNTGT